LGADLSNGILGQSVIVGSKVWGRQHKFRIILGPLSAEDYVRLLPTGDRIRRLVTLVRNYIGDELAWDVRLILKREHVSPVRLDGNFRLGWTTWLGERTSEKDADDLVLNAFNYVK
jgi:type VI secretion system protein ImpH